MMEERDTEIKRTAIEAPTRERIWGRAAARCVLCSKWLVDEREFWHAIPVGQIAHNVAASAGPKAPRGELSLTAKERAAEANLLLLCGDCHRRIDSVAYRDAYTVEFLTSKKLTHERRVREVTDFATLRPSTVIRLVASVRGTAAPATPAQVGEALRRAGLTGMGADTRTGAFEVDLRHDERSSWTWDASKKAIDEAVARAQEAIAAHDTAVLSVFAIAPIPTLVYFGAALDDKIETRLFPRKRGDDVDVWTWPETSGKAQSFDLHVCDDGSPDVLDVVALVDVTATVDESRIPQELETAPIVRLAVAGDPGPDALASPTDLDAFARGWRDLLSKVESRWPALQRLHLIAAVPTTAAITLGRHRMRGVHPTFVVYQRTCDGTYEAALEVAG